VTNKVPIFYEFILKLKLLCQLTHALQNLLKNKMKWKSWNFIFHQHEVPLPSFYFS